ncbi:MAG: HAD-IIIC family phosphatase [Ktedonobacterales bacterium]
MDSGLVLHIADYYLKQRRLDEARATLASLPETATPRDRERFAAAWARLAQAYLARRNADAAEEALAQSRALADTTDAERAAALLAAAHGAHGAAVACWRRVVAAHPDEASAWLALARELIAASQPDEAAAAYLRAAQVDPTHATVLTVAERLAELAPSLAEPPAAARVRIAILGSSTLNDVQSYMDVACRQAGLSPTFYLGPFDQYAQDILNDASPLYAFAPDVLILAIHGRALFPALYDAPFDLDVEERRTAATDVVERMVGLLRELTRRTGAHVLLHTFATPQYSPLGTLDLRDPFGQTALFQAINSALAERVRLEFPSVHLIDEDRVYGRVGKRSATDPRMWYLARIGIGEGALAALTTEYMRFLTAIMARTRKCLVLDLDNTLWGGVVGEDGPAGIALGQEAPGNAFVAFQEAILRLWKRGVILAVNSKNNEADALEVLERHPDMVLRPSHFAAMRINWQDKATNLIALAQELNIGLDSLVFVDDNPAECALVRSRLPEVLTVELPSDPALYRGVLLDLVAFDTLALTDEDRERGRLYAQRRERQAWESRAAESLDTYLGDLGLVVEVAPADAFALPRVAQLLGKTNQFNLTTRRHSESVVRAFAESPDSGVYSVRVRDRFGDAGLTGVAIVRKMPAVWEVDTLLLSCRVLGRGVETALLSVLVEAARANGAATLRGEFLRTAKNAPAADFYPRHGFVLVAEQGETQTWALDLSASTVIAPAWVTLSVLEGAAVQS